LITAFGPGPDTVLMEQSGSTKRHLQKGESNEKALFCRFACLSHVPRSCFRTGVNRKALYLAGTEHHVMMEEGDEGILDASDRTRLVFRPDEKTVFDTLPEVKANPYSLPYAKITISRFITREPRMGGMKGLNSSSGTISLGACWPRSKPDLARQWSTKTRKPGVGVRDRRPGTSRRSDQAPIQRPIGLRGIENDTL
jgi:hypothetical protein